MHASEFLPHLERELAAFAARLENDLGVAVPSCPGWTAETLVSHVGQVHRFALQQLAAGPGAELDLTRGPAPNDTTQLVPWYLEGASRLVAALESTDPDEHRPNWAGVPTASFYFRRMTHEMAVHRWDLETATGNVSPIDGTLAVDGIDEIGELYGNRLTPAALGGASTCLRLRAENGVTTDWSIRADDEDVVFDRGDDAAPTTIVRGPASDLLLLLWNRVDISSVAVGGDPAPLAGVMGDLAGI